MSFAFHHVDEINQKNDEKMISSNFLVLLLTTLSKVHINQIE